MAATGLMLGGCASYAPKRLDMPEHARAFDQRRGDEESVAAWAERLGAGQAGGEHAFDITDGVSLAEAEAILMVYSTDLRLARLRAGVTLAGAANAGKWEDPTLGVDLARILESTAHPWKVFSTLAFTIPLSGRLEVEKSRASAEHAVELARIAQSEWSTRIALREAWAEWSAAVATVESTRELQSETSDLLRIVSLMERSGDLSRMQSRLFTLEDVARRAELTSAEARVAEAELGIKRLMGLPPRADIRLVPELRARGSAAAASGDDGATIISGPAMATALAAYEVAERSLELEVRKTHPDLVLGPGYGREDGQNQFLLGINVPLPILNGNARGIAEAHATRELARGEAEAVLESLTSDLELARTRLRAATARRSELERTLVPMVDEQERDLNAVAKLGDVDVLVMIESRKRRHEARLHVIEAREAEAIAEARIGLVLGPPTRETQMQKQNEGAKQ